MWRQSRLITLQYHVCHSDLRRHRGVIMPDISRRLADFRHLVVRHITPLILCFAAGAIEPASAAGSAANVDAARITGANQDPANWTTYGRTYSEQRFSPLA